VEQEVKAIYPHNEDDVRKLYRSLVQGTVSVHGEWQVMVMSAFEKKDPGKFTVRFNMADHQRRP
jgi:hypothetical protein